ncbi:MAG: CRTAC1 family protein [Pirellulales bacterium]
MVRRWWVIIAVVVVGWVLAIVWQNWRAENDPWNAVAKNQPPSAVDETPGASVAGGSSSGDVDAAKSVHYLDLIQERNKLYDTVWSNEKLSQQYEETFVALWDALRPAADQFAVLGKFPFAELRLARPGKATDLDWGIRRTTCDAEPFSLAPGDFRRLLGQFAADGWRLVQSEWHHATFDPPTAERAARSTVNFVLHVANEKQQRWAIVKGKLGVEWQRERNSNGDFQPRVLDAVGVELLTLAGPPAFVPMTATPNVLAPSPTWGGIDMAEPILLADLTGDGLSEILIGGRNLALQFNSREGTFRPSLISSKMQRMSSAALVADVTGDGEIDLTYIAQGPTADAAASLVVLSGHGGQFKESPVVGWQGPCGNPTAMTAGDIDGDGDLDLFLGQYKAPYGGGQMPTPYFDANDGLPAYLLINDGQGKFTDGTVAAGLGKKRHRRTYGASLVDLDGDGHLDLLVTSDFAGIDIYRNDGKGRFTDVTDAWVDDRHNFGMSHTLADYDLDGQLDFYVIGMSSTTARRLDYLKLGRDDRAEINRMRGQMGYGNRMFLARGGKFVQPEWKDQVARTGWSWGSTSLDFDNDGDRDIYVANGHQSGKSSRDYCTQFWTQDIYTGDSNPNTDIEGMFGICLSDLHSGEASWNGFEHNALLMNLGGKGFVDVAFLLGVAFEFDARSVLSDDFDGDGRMDLAVVENRVPRPGLVRQTLHVLANRFDPPGPKRHWIGVRLTGAAGVSPLGATVTLKTSHGEQPARIVAGDSLYCQHAPRVHFGLGASADVTAIEIRWPNGKVTTLDRPAVDRYHVATPANE